jgi:hypothetical protein
MSDQNHIHKVSRRLFMEACGQLNTDIAAMRRYTVRLAAEAAAEPQPEQQLLDSLACIEERLRAAQTAIEQNALIAMALMKREDEGGKP